jgi:hypothetical protein
MKMQKKSSKRNEPRLDRSAMSSLSFEEADTSISQFHEQSWQERLIIAKRLTAIAYDFPLDNPPKMDKTYFEIHQHHG